ncbi:MAG: hypothetical protein IH946_04540 [Bacteroidetes bacterium]|nr:hypothetical protein [Bacteroidota bacterium]
MARRFVSETNLPLTFDEELTRDILWNAINDDNSILLVDDQDGVLAGAIMGYMDTDFCKEYSAYITKLFIEKEFRGFRVSMDLIRAFEEETKNAKLLFTSATAGMGERIEKLYVHLFRKAGYSVLGRILVKEIT